MSARRHRKNGSAAANRQVSANPTPSRPGLRAIFGLGYKGGRSVFAETKIGAGPAIGRRRRWLFRLTAAILAPMLFFAALEAGLRLGGYGYPTTFFVGPDANGTYTVNPRFGWRFFPREISRKPEPHSLSAKPAGAVRIFVVGSSAAQGVPNPSLSFGRILEVLLRDRYPGVQFEVINAAMTATNSHIAIEIARDCAAHEPDLFIVYMGNNEIVGPYGPGTIFQKWSPSLGMIRANIWLKSTRVGQLFDNAITCLRPGKGTPASWQGMEMFLNNPVAADDPRLETVYANYRRNLIDLCGIARRSGAAVILSTVAVNLADSAPFASRHRGDLSPAELAKWESIYQAGVGLESKEKWSDAIAKYKAAARIDDRFADLHFRMGRCFAEENRLPEARDHFVLARDLDVLRFRADTRINSILREVAAEQKNAGVWGVDAEEALAKSDEAADGILGGDLFYEHVHFTFDGNYLLAKAVLEQVDAALPRLVISRKAGPALSRTQCAEALAFTPRDEYLMAEEIALITSRPPFTNQLDYAARQASATKHRELLGEQSQTPRAFQAACRCYESALEKMPDDGRLHHRYGKLATAAGDPETAIEHLRIALTKLPSEPFVYVDIGEAEQACGRIDEAVDHFQKALKIDPDLATVNYNLGVIRASRGQTDDAIDHYRRALKLDPKMAMAHNNLGAILVDRKQIEDGISHYQKALEINPKLVMAHNNLGIALADCGRMDEAIAHYQKALEIDPKLIAVHNNLGSLLAKCGRTDEAIAHFRRLLEIKPDCAPARRMLIELTRHTGGSGKSLDEKRIVNTSTSTSPN
jgi:tetratricopeptide (TPR) repeat protein